MLCISSCPSVSDILSADIVFRWHCVPWHFAHNSYNRPPITLFVFSKTGLLVVGKTGSKELEDFRKSLENVGVEYETLSSQSLRAKYPSLSFDDSFSAVFDPTAGILRADKCLNAFQVWIGQNVSAKHALSLASTDYNRKSQRASEDPYPNC